MPNFYTLTNGKQVELAEILASFTKVPNPGYGTIAPFIAVDRIQRVLDNAHTLAVDTLVDVRWKHETSADGRAIGILPAEACENPGRCAVGELLFALGYSNIQLAALD